MVEASILARGAPSNALGAVGSFKMPKVVGHTPAQLFRALACLRRGVMETGPQGVPIR
jgi:hypothetical protein